VIGCRYAATLPSQPASDACLTQTHPWVTPAPGSYHLQARATDTTGRTQPVTAVHNTGGYLFDGIVQHPITTA
jgi:hypothetical protein